MAQGRSAAGARVGYAVSYDSGGGDHGFIEIARSLFFSDDMIRRQY